MSGKRRDDQHPDRPDWAERTAAAPVPSPDKAPEDSSARCRGQGRTRRYTLLDWKRFRQNEERQPAVTPELSVIGAGAMGRVLLALDERVGRVVAIKEMQESMRRSASRRFLREARVTGALEHPGIIPVHDLGKQGERSYYYTMRLVRGRSLGDALRSAGTLRERLALLHHVTDLCHAIAFAHSQGIIHRDIKPDNVMVGAFGETVVLDWGLARAVDDEDMDHGPVSQAGLAASLDPSRTAPNVIMGTPSYMSPEQAMGEKVDAASDIWALGAILYRLLTGKVPVPGRGAKAKLRWLQDPDDPVEPVARHCRQAPRELASVAMRCLARAKADRYGDAREIARDLERYQAGERVVSHHYTVWELLRHMVNRNRPLSVAVGLGVLVAVTAAVLFVLAREARLEAEEYRAKNAWEQLLLARAALNAERPLEAEARLRHSLEDQDSLLGRALWSRILGTPLLLREKLETEVTGMDFSPDGTRLAVASASSDLVLLDSWTGARETLPGPGRTLYVVSWSPAGDKLAAGSGGGEVVLWNDLTGDPQQLSGHADIVSTLAFDRSGQLLLSGSFDGTARLWDLAAMRQLRSYEAHEGPITTVAWNPSEESFATAGADHSIRIWDRRDGQVRATLQGHKGEVTGLAWLDEGRSLVSASYDGTLRSWDPATGRQTDLREAPSTQFTILVASDSGRVLAAGDRRGQIHTWSPPDARQARVMEGQRSIIFGLALDGDGRRIASGGTDRTVYLWNPSAAGSSPVEEGHEGVVTAVDFHPDGSRLASAGWDGRVCSWDRASGAHLGAWRSHDDIVHSLRISPDGQLLATGAADGTIRIQDAADGRLRRLLTGHYGAVRSLAFSPDGQELASAGYAGLIFLWDLASGASRTVLDVRGRTAVAFAPAGRVLATAWSAADQAHLRVLDLDTERVLLEDEVGDPEVKDLVFGPGGDKLYAVTRYGEVRAWDLDSGSAQAQLALQGQGCSVQADASGRYLAATSTVPAVRLHDLQQVGTKALHGHHGPVADSAFDPSGQLLVTAGYDGTVRSWEVATGRPGWRATALLASHGLRHGHEGWLPLEGADPGSPPDQGWSRALQTRARIASETTDGRGLCLQTWDGAIERWDMAGDQLLSTHVLPQASALVASASSCAALLEDGSALMLRSDWQEPSQLASSAAALGRDGQGLLIASEGALLVFDAQGGALGRIESPFGEPTAAAGTADLVLVGERHGEVALIGRQTEAPQRAKLLQDTPTSAARTLTEGPAGTVAVGFADGSLGLWDGDSGTQLIGLRLHGPIQQTGVHGNRLHALSETGAYASLDLEFLERERCALLREVWDRVPVIWDGARAQSSPPPLRHACLAQASR